MPTPTSASTSAGVIASPSSQPSLGRWTRTEKGLNLIEEGITYPTEILSLSPHDGGYAAQAVQGGIMRFGSQNGGRERGRSAHGISTAKSDCAYRKRGDAYFTCAAAEPRNGFFRRESPGTGWY